MSVLGVPVRSEGRPRPLAWRRMVWVIWRQHRLALSGVVAFLGALSLWAWRAGLQLRHAHAAAIACDRTSIGACDIARATFDRSNSFLAHGYPLFAAPALIGAFVGAPLLAREFETGTFRFVWTQGIGRTRWTLAKLVSLAVTTSAIAGLFSILLYWYYEPYLDTRNAAQGLVQFSPLEGGIFPLRGVAFASWTLVAFTIGALAGVITRRVVPAIIATLASYTAIAVGVTLVLRQRYQAPLVDSDQPVLGRFGWVMHVPASAWTLGHWGTRDGKLAFTGLPPLSLLQHLCPTPPAAGASKLENAAHCLGQHDYTLWTRYQPATRFWPFQLIEAGWLLALSALLLATTVWLVRRRAT